LVTVEIRPIGAISFRHCSGRLWIFEESRSDSEPKSIHATSKIRVAPLMKLKVSASLPYDRS
jgi:hypothetical protein